ncbi:hypothetical protein Poli38472_014048 [Pythium oligandrum]|uniref:AMP-dependent synthetase/ligase domain-containing protein n=1 Tax=Pythium oligandrum TaxID=41045 RepID=A0A8K1FL38_PYTOL|nr:hypothetical protein Poli38472_014048 [Pythium oligandrum]|eukprot:TMW66736.1 hypothetical protein Poli38472_014048 [Pythium oligandrum]
MLGMLRVKGLARVAGSQAQRLVAVRAASTVGGALDEAVERLPHKEAFRSIKQDLRWSFKELDSYVQDLANGFNSLQLQPGDVLAVWLPNNAENYVTHLAAAKAGLTLAVIDPEISSAEEVKYILEDTKASGILYEPKIGERNQSAIIAGLFPELATYGQRQEAFRPKSFRHLHTVISTGQYEEGVIPFRQIFVNSPESHTVAAVKQAISEKTPLAVTFTKGDGKTPKKGAVLTHGDVLKRAADLAKSVSLTVEDKICLTSEEQGLSFAPVAAIEKNAMVVIPSVEYDHEAVQYAIKLESPSIVGTGAANFKRV